MGSNKLQSEDDRAPLLGTWGAWYAVVIGTLVLVIAVFSAISRAYR